jgi:lariat debranching enzyme
MPAKYREMHDFHQYYSGSRTAPYLTIFIGGNHEASNYLFELYYGGWVAPNIYYMGAANLLKLGPLRIAGMSGIWKGFDYKKQHFERLPYNEGDVKSIYHVRELDVRKLLQVRTQVHVATSHDWPRGVEWKGDWKRLFRQKPHLEEDARNGQLGSVAASYVLDRLRPPYWFSAHLHCKYAAVIDHEKADGPAATAIPPGANKNSDEIDLDMDDEPAPVKGTDEIDLDMDQDDEQLPNTATIPINADELDLELEDAHVGNTATVAPGQGLDGAKVPLDPSATSFQPSSSTVPEDVRAQLPASFAKPPPRADTSHQPITHPSAITNTKTRFLALDKCLPNRDFLQMLSIPATATATATATTGESNTTPLTRPLSLEYDKEWLAITRVFASSLTLNANPSSHPPPDLGESTYLPQILAQEQWVQDNIASLTVPENFTITAPVYDDGQGINVDASLLREYSNPQTMAFCALLGIENPFHLDEQVRDERMRVGPRAEEVRRDGGGYKGHRGRGGGGGGGRGRGGRGSARGHRGGNRGGRGRGGY